MTARPIHKADPDDPAEVLRILPPPWPEQFVAEYQAALDAAREVRRWHERSALLRRWRLRAAAYSDPEFEVAIQKLQYRRPQRREAVGPLR